MKKLIILCGPTGVGKTDTSIFFAKHFGTEIVSCDSRQFYRELKIGTAVPALSQLSSVPHHLIGNKSIHDYYNVFLFEQDALKTIARLFENHDIVFMVGGSGLYVDVMKKGIDEIPDIDETIRNEVGEFYKAQGIEGLQKELLKRDPDFYANTDLNNYKRIIRAIEVCRQTGKPYSSHRIEKKITRPFSITTVCLTRDREELYTRINKRVEIMMEDGLLEEVKANEPFRNLNALNTVGYKELFSYLDGDYSLERAIELIQRNTRHYAKKQLSWYRRDPEIIYSHPDSIDEIIRTIQD